MSKESLNKDDDENKWKTKIVSEHVSVIKCKLNTIINNCKDNKLHTIIKDHVFKANKIILEGIYLFNIYLLHIIEKNIMMPITTTTIRRCMRHLLTNASKSRSTGNADEDKLIADVKEQYFDFLTDGREHDFLCNENGLMKPLEATCDAYLTNIKLHIRLNFKKYQRRYIMCKLTKYIESLSIDECLNDSKFLLYAIQQHINGNIKYSYKTDKRINRYNKLFEELKIDNFIKQETKILKDYINLDIESGDEISSVSDTEIFNYLRYFSVMLKELTVNNIRRFSLIPHFVPKIRYIRFEARPLCEIYNKWTNKTINVTDFEKKFQMYLNEMFAINKQFKKRLKKYPTIRSISTDGYSVSIGFQKTKEIRYLPKAKKSSNELSNKPKPIKKSYTKTKKGVALLNLETVYLKLPKNTGMIFDANELKTTEDFLNKFNIAGADPGNMVMLDVSLENGLHFTIHKNYYNDVANITRNKQLLDAETEKKKMNEIYSDMSLETIKTTSINEYMKYVKIVRKNWDRIWDFCTSPKIISLKFDSYVNKDKAISRIAKEIIMSVKDESKVYPRHSKYFNKQKYDEDKNKPLLLAIGTGNGNMTISNTKNSTPKGPIKKLVKELSKYCIVILVPENNTSQLCCECGNFLEPVSVYKFQSKNKQNQNKFESGLCADHESVEDDMENKISEIKISLTKENKKMINTNKKIISNIDGKTTNNQLKNQKIIDIIKEHNRELVEKIKNTEYYGESYRLRRCAHKHEETNRCLLWERNMNASLNMPKMMRSILLTGTKGIFADPKGRLKLAHTKKKDIGGSLMTDTNELRVGKELSILAYKDNQITNKDRKSIKKENVMQQIKAKITEIELTDILDKTKVLVKGKKQKPIRSALYSYK